MTAVKQPAAAPLENSVTVPPPKDGAWKPAAIDPALWDSVPARDRPEALARAAFLLVTKGLLPDAALVAALENMRSQEADAEDEFLWETARKIALWWPAPQRLPDGGYPYAVIAAAGLVERLAISEAEIPGNVGNPRQYFAKLPHLAAKAACDAYEGRRLALLPAPDPETLPEPEPERPAAAAAAPWEDEWDDLR